MSSLYVCFKYLSIGVVICNFETIGKVHWCGFKAFSSVEFKMHMKFVTLPLFNLLEEGGQDIITFLL